MFLAWNGVLLVQDRFRRLIHVLERPSCGRKSGFVIEVADHSEGIARATDQRKRTSATFF